MTIQIKYDDDGNFAKEAPVDLETGRRIDGVVSIELDITARPENRKGRLIVRAYNSTIGPYAIIPIDRIEIVGIVNMNAETSIDRKPISR